MRYISVALLSLVIRTSNNPDYSCHEIRRRLPELPPSEPQWLQSLLQTCDSEFVWDIIRGKPRAASDDMEGLEGQDEIQIDEMNKIGDKGRGDTQNNNGILRTYIPQTLFLYIYQVGVASTTYIYFS